MRNLVAEAQSFGDLEIVVLPVALSRRGLISMGILNVETHRIVPVSQRLLAFGRSLFKRSRSGRGGSGGKSAVQSSRALEILWYWYYELILLLLFPPRKVQKLTPGPNDIFVFSDAGWNVPPTTRRSSFLGQCSVGYLVYDTIPYTNPEYCRPTTVQRYLAWLDELGGRAEFAITISQTVADQLAYALRQRGFACPPTRSIRLGADLPLRTGSATIRPVVEDLMQRPFFLMVGTIEPRKNHGSVLDAFDRVWEQDKDLVLVVVGRAGWLCESIVDRMERHPRLGSTFWWISGASDDELVALYQSSQAVITASFVEGFGLPVVEARAFGVPVIASDIPSHREVGGNGCVYFDPADVDHLAMILTSFAAKAHSPCPQPTWADSARDFIEAAEHLAGAHDS